MAGQRRAPAGRGSIYRDEAGWHGWVSLGTDPLTGKRRRRHLRGATRAEVVKAVQKLEAERESGDLDLTGGPVTVKVWLRHWQAGVAASRRALTSDRYDWACRLWLVPTLGHLQLDKLTPELLTRAFAGLTRDTPTGTKAASSNTRREVMEVLRTALNAAVEARRIPRNPALLVRLPPRETAEVQPLTADEIAAILRVCADRRNGARWVFALALGLRQSEALGLRWSDIDLDAQTVTVRHQLARQLWAHGCANPGACGRPGRCPRRAPRPLLAPLKTRGGRRGLHLDDALVERLRAHKRAQTKERLRAANLWQEGDWLFASQVGTPVQQRNDLRDWRAVLDAAGVDHARIHDLRHTHATLLLLSGVQPRVAQDLLGWSSTAMAGRYQHVVPELSRQAATLVGERLFGASTKAQDQEGEVGASGPMSSSA